MLGINITLLQVQVPWVLYGMRCYLLTEEYKVIAENYLEIEALHLPHCFFF